MTGVAVQAMLVGMPTPQDLRRSEVGNRVLITVGATVLFSYECGDAGLRNLAAVTLPEMGFTGRRVAQVLELSEEYVSMLRARARREGSAGLIRWRGRPSALKARDLDRARSWRAAGEADAAIGRRLGVHGSTVARALAGVERPDPAGGVPEAAMLPVVAGETETTEPAVAELDDTAVAGAEPAVGAPAVGFTGSARVGTGSYRCRYAGRCCCTPTWTWSAPRGSSRR